MGIAFTESARSINEPPGGAPLGVPKWRTFVISFIFFQLKWNKTWWTNWSISLFLFEINYFGFFFPFEELINCQEHIKWRETTTLNTSEIIGYGSSRYFSKMKKKVCKAHEYIINLLNH